MAKAGRKRDVLKEAHYWQLLSTGMGTVQACREAGIGRRTGLRWRIDAERQAREQDAAARSDRFLSEQERQQIAGFRDRGMGVREIGRQLGRSASTISRELQRNSDSGGGYEPVAAEKAARVRRARPKPSKLARNQWLRRHVHSQLKADWSPEQISNTLRLQFPDDPDRQVGTETIYRELYRCDGEGLSRALCAHLRTKRDKRQRRGAITRQRFIDPMTPIRDRPEAVADRQEPGHWEGDLITGRANKSAIGTLVERRTGMIKLVHLPTDHSADSLKAALIPAAGKIPKAMRRTLTWDQGVEMAGHRPIAAATGLAVFFADAGSPWQRGTNENANGLLRQYFPKSTDLSAYSPADLREVEKRLNSRPRKRLGWKTPEQEFNRLLRDWPRQTVATTP